MLLISPSKGGIDFLAPTHPHYNIVTTEMISLVKRLLPTPLHPAGRTILRKTRTRLIELHCALDRRVMAEDELVCHLKRFGVLPGATIYLHSSMDQIMHRVPTLTPFTFILILKKLLGPEGTLLAPTFPFGGLQYYYIQKERTFNVKHSPSMVGLFTELFRRTEGVTRSLHPTHPIAAWGKHSRELVAEHHLGTAFGRKSPVYKMQAFNGLIVGLGVTPKNCFTLYHVAEELHPKSYAMNYCNESFDMKIINDTEEILYRVTPMRPDRIRRYGRAEHILRREGILRYEKVKGLEISSASVHQFLQRSSELIETNMFYSSM